MMLRAALEATGFVVLEATTGHGAVQLVHECHPDLVTLDMILPGFDGVEVCRRIRDQTDAYIIMITASSDEADRLVGLATGADDYVLKPFSPREVQARVTAMFRRPRSVPTVDAAPAEIEPNGPVFRLPTPRRADAVPSPLPGAVVPASVHEPGPVRHGPLSIDIDGRVAWLEDTELALTKIEFDLLVTLVGNPGRVWRRETLLNIVWGGQWTDYHVVEVHIGNLRRKLGDAAAEGAALIKTVRGIGYRMAPDQVGPKRSTRTADRSTPMLTSSWDAASAKPAEPQT
jgi:two-component system OmpR family response regulator